MDKSYTLTAANDNELGRAVVVRMTSINRSLDVLADIFAGLLNETPTAANDNGIVRSQKGG